MSETIKGILNKLEKCDDFHNRCDYLLEHDEITYLLEYITNLQKENELHNKIIKDANDVLNIQAQKSNYNYDSYMLGLYNGMEMIVSLFEQREPKLKCGKDIKFLHETDYKSRNEKAVEYLKSLMDSEVLSLERDNEAFKGIDKKQVAKNEVVLSMLKTQTLLNILQGGDE